MAKAIVVAAPSSGSGKTTVTLGLLRALKNRGVKVASAKVGPDYIDFRFHERASGRPCYNLDFWAMSPAQMSAILARATQDAEIVIIEGVMGLFDGPHAAKGSTADLAVHFGLPVLLTVDCRHQAQSVAALVHGFRTFRPEVNIAGVVLNRVASDRHETILRHVLGGDVAGVVRQSGLIELPSRHLGLVQAMEIEQLFGKIDLAGKAIEQSGLPDRVIELAGPIGAHPEHRRALRPLAQTIAIASDRAFSFAYPHVLDCWQSSGASLSFFSPLNDEPPGSLAEAVYLPGGYPELFAGQLAANAQFLDGLRRHEGLVYGECGGYMVLGESLVDAKGNAHRMAGLLPLETSFTTPRLHLGYRKLKPVGGLPYATALSGHEFHYSTIEHEGEAERLFEAEDAAGTPLPPMGLRRGRVMGSYAHVICEAE